MCTPLCMQRLLARLDDRLSEIQDTMAGAPKMDSGTARERDVDEHLSLMSNSSVDHMLKVGSRSSPSRLTVPSTNYRSDRKVLCKPNVIPLPKSSVRGFARSTKLVKTTDAPDKSHSPLRNEATCQCDGDPALTELAAQISSDQAVLNAKLVEMDERKVSGDLELKSLAMELRDLQIELRSQLTELQRHLPSVAEENTPEPVTSEPTAVAPSHGQPVVGIGSLLPSLRTVMDHALQKFVPPHGDLPNAFGPSDILPKAASVLASVTKRRANLENNLATLERSQQERSLFALFEQIHTDPNSAYIARAQAMVTEAIANASRTKQVKTVTKQPPVVSRLCRLGDKKSRQAPNRTPTPNEPISFTDLLPGFPTLPTVRRSMSPEIQSVPWRLNRRRSQRQLYPRLVNDPVLSRRAALRFSNEDDAPGIQPPRSSSAPLTKIVRFHMDNAGVTGQQVRIPHSAGPVGTSPVRIMLLGQRQYSGQPAEPNKITAMTQTTPLTKPTAITHDISTHALETSDKMVEIAGSPSHVLSSRSVQTELKHPLLSEPAGLSEVPTLGAAHLFERGSGMQYEKQSDFSHNVLTTGAFPAPHRPDAEGEIFSRLLLQLAGQMAQQNQTTAAARPPYPIPSHSHLRELVEEALLEHIAPMLPCSPASSPEHPPVRLPTPFSSPERLSVDRSGLDQPLTHSLVSSSPTRAQPTIFDVGVGHSSRASAITPIPEDHVPGTGRYSDDHRPPCHDIPTPYPSLPGSEMYPPATPPMSSYSPNPAPSRLPVPRSVQTSPTSPAPIRSVSPASLPLGSHSTEYTPLTNGVPSPVETNGVSSFSSEPFSSTVPNTLSEGAWLLDRSEGEAPSPLPYALARKTAQLVGPISPVSLSELSRDDLKHDTLTNASEITEDDQHLSKRRLSAGELSLIKRQREDRHSARDPLKNPVLHVVALQQSSYFDTTKLPTRDKNAVAAALTVLKKRRPQPKQSLNPLPHDVSNDDSSPSTHHTSSADQAITGRPMQQEKTHESVRLEWLQGLASISQLSERSQKSGKAKHHSSGEPEGKHPVFCAEQAKSQTHESDATSIEEEAYADDYEVAASECSAELNPTAVVSAAVSPVVSSRYHDTRPLGQTITLDSDDDSNEFERP
ncbi:unnamed protein product [Dicrocoelium dendriticum]|nr:unnamed protein product [Dicrocoelium dendriticum]